MTSIEAVPGYAFFSARSADRERARETRELLIEQLAADGVPIELLQFAPARVSFACSAADARGVLAASEAAGFSAHLISPCVKVAIAGRDIARTSGVIASIVKSLRERDVELLHFADGGSALTLVVREAQAERAERVLRALFLPSTGGNSLGAFSLDDVRGIVRVDGRAVRLGARQIRLLRYLVDNEGQVVSAERIANAVFSGTEKDVASVRVHVHNLRKKMERDPFAPRYVVTVPNQGYLFAM